jgi:hypothetical protein
MRPDAPFRFLWFLWSVVAHVGQEHLLIASGRYEAYFQRPWTAWTAPH